MAEKVDFKFRIIAQKRVYLCMGFREIGADTRALEVIRERDSENYEVPTMPRVIFKGDVIIEPIITRPGVIVAALQRELARLTDAEWAQAQEMWDQQELERAEELAGRG